MNKASLVAEIRRLSPEERLDLIEDIWDSLDETDIMVSPTEVQLAEAKHRLEEHRRNPGTAIPAEEVLAELRSLLK